MTETLLHTTIASPVGRLLLVSDGERLRGLYMQEGHRPARVQAGWRPASEPFADAREQLGQYFEGERSEFSLPFEPAGTSFQHEVWAALTRIPYGRTASYGELAHEIGHPAAARAVGLANSRNPISIIVPCHRVVGAHGALTGYAGGVERKRHLLELEGAKAG